MSQPFMFNQRQVSARRRFRYRGAFSAILIAIGLLGASALSAQVQSANAKAKRSANSGRTADSSASDSSVSEAIKRSGLSTQAVRSRLKSEGFDPALIDAYLKSSGGSTGSDVSPPKPFVDALERMGILVGPDDQAADDPQLDSSEGADMAPDAARDLSGAPRARSDAAGRGIFGKTLFARAASLFDPVTAGPVDPSYRVGVGDQIQLVMTGAVEAAYQLEIRRDGTVVIPQVGQISIAGLTLDGVRSLLRERASRSFSGIRSGEVTLDATIARIRSNVVFVTGEVERPGAFQVNALSTSFHAIAKAGGPTDRGSFREIEIRRAGVVVKRLDLYDYLLQGDASTDIRTEQGDVIFVPLNKRSIQIRGGVRRPAIFELKTQEGFGDLVRYSGGFLPSANLDRVQIDRILPPEQRVPGRERVLMDVKINGRIDALSAVPLNDGDVVTVFYIGDIRRNKVTVQGQVFQPGVFEYSAGMSLQQLINQAQGLQPWAVRDRVKITRLVPETGRSEIVSVDMRDPSAASFPLREYDDVTVLDARGAFPMGKVEVYGAVKSPGQIAFADRQTLQDAIDLVGGLKEDALGVDVSRRRRGSAYSDTTSFLNSFRATASMGLEPDAQRFLLESDDRIYVRSAPGFRDQQIVDISGLFRYPGKYALVGRGERVRDVVQRAGGLLPDAFGKTFRLVRSGRPVAVDFDALMRGDEEENIPLEAGDQLFISANSNTVFVTGEVERGALVMYERGKSLRAYIDRAGGARATADMSRIRIDYPNGSSASIRTRFLLPDAVPEIVPGSVIYVPAKAPSEGSKFTQNIATVAQTASALASIVITYLALRK